MDMQAFVDQFASKFRWFSIAAFAVHATVWTLLEDFQM